MDKRRSRRQFDANRHLEPEKLLKLETVCNQFLPFPGARSCLVTNPIKDVFKGIIGSYGKVKDAPAFIAFIGNMDRATVQEEVGYTGEGVILEATALDLPPKVIPPRERYIHKYQIKALIFPTQLYF
ncbi:nitroreductase family protein [Chloroflexota bacterium]